MAKDEVETMHLEDGDLQKDVAEGVISGEERLSPEEDKRILRKVDMCLLPVMAMSYLFQFLDKSALGYTAIMGIREDLGLTGQDYSWSSSIYYFGYLIASYPAGVIMVRWRVGKLIAASVLIWGAILMLTPLCFNSTGLLTNRFFLGVAEAAIAPGLSIVVAMWYKRSEQPLRHGAWYLGNTCAGFFGGVSAYGIGHIQTIASWKAVYLIFGALTVAWSFAIFFLLPDVPGKARFLSKSDRAKAVQRVEENMTGIKSSKFKWHQCIEAILDIKTWLLLLIQVSSNIGNGGVLTFGSIVVQGLGFSMFNTLLVQMISIAFQLVFVVTASAGSTFFRNTRTYWMACNLAFSIIGSAMIREIPDTHKWARFMGFCLTLGYTGNLPVLLSVASANFGGFTKKTTVNSLIFIAYCAGNIVGPQLFFAKEAPSYTSGFLAITVCFAIGFVACFVLRFYLIWENKRRDRVGGVLEAEESNHTTLNMMDKTDKEIPQFRYMY